MVNEVTDDCVKGCSMRQAGNGWVGWMAVTVNSSHYKTLNYGAGRKERFDKLVLCVTGQPTPLTGVTSTAGSSLAGDEYVRLLW